VEASESEAEGRARAVGEGGEATRLAGWGIETGERGRRPRRVTNSEAVGRAVAGLLHQSVYIIKFYP
jgi:hypothetical protein